MTHEITINETAPWKETHSAYGDRWFVYHESDTQVRLLGSEDLRTGVILTSIILNPDTRGAAHKAWAAARRSRAPGKSWEILREMGKKGIDPDQKLEETFTGYGHGSVADGARTSVDFDNIPMHFAWDLFNEGYINSGQENSSRYQKKFAKANLHSAEFYLPPEISPEDLNLIKAEYQEIGDMAQGYFQDAQNYLTKCYGDFYKPGDTKQEKDAFTSRVLDSARFFLPSGTITGMNFETSMRDWSRIIAEFKASPVKYYQQVGEHLQRFFVPTPEEEEALQTKAEAPSLVRHADAYGLVNQNLSNLKEFVTTKSDLLQNVQINRMFRGEVAQAIALIPREYSASEKMVAHYLLTLWPGLDQGQLMNWVRTQARETKIQISNIILDGHDNYKELPNMAATTEMSLIVSGFLGEVRDFNRHKAYTRFLNLPAVYGERMAYDTFIQIFAKGYGVPLYLNDKNHFKEEAAKFRGDMWNYYASVYKFAETLNQRFGNKIDYSLLVNLLPLAHQVDLWMHGNPKQGLYLTDRRVKNGGHINYRQLAYDANILIASSDPYLEGMRFDNKQPDPFDRSQFFDRS